MSKIKIKINFRVTNDQKDMIQRAAKIRGLTVSSFAIETLVEQAKYIVEKENVTILSDRDHDLFLKMLDVDDEPNEALKKAAKYYKKHYGQMAN